MNADENKTSQPTPEQLLKMLDLQLQSMRSKRNENGHRNSVRAASILFVLLAAAAAFFYLTHMLNEARQQQPGRATKPATNQHQ